MRNKCSKGRIISKHFLVASDSSKKRRNKFVFSTVRQKTRIHLFIFWKNPRISKIISSGSRKQYYQRTPCIPKKSHLQRSPATAHAYQRTIKASKTNLCPNIFQCRCSFLPIGYIYDFNIGYSWQLSWIKLDQACWVAFFNIVFYLIWVRQKGKKVRHNSYALQICTVFPLCPLSTVISLHGLHLITI